MVIWYLACTRSSPGLEGSPWQATHSAVFSVDFGVALAVRFWNPNQGDSSCFLLYRSGFFSDTATSHQGSELGSEPSWKYSCPYSCHCMGAQERRAVVAMQGWGHMTKAETTSLHFGWFHQNKQVCIWRAVENRQHI